MITSGIVLTLSADPALAQRARMSLLARPELTLGECTQRWLPLVAEVVDVSTGRDLHDWLSALPGVDYADVVQVNFDDEEIPNATTTEAVHEL